MTYSDLIGISLGAMYDSLSWPDFAALLADLEAAAASPAAARRRAGRRSGCAARRALSELRRRLPGRRLLGQRQSARPRGLVGAGAAAEAQFGYFGRLWTWASSPCAVWQGFDADRYLGPFNRTTANPVLVVGNRFDPATRYQGAQIVDDLLPSSRLLTVEGWGHTSILLSRCADEVVARYLLAGLTPAAGTTCAQDFGPFDAAAARGAAGSRARVRARALKEIAPRPVP